MPPSVPCLVDLRSSSFSLGKAGTSSALPSLVRRFLVILGNGFLHVLFPESGRSPGMDGCQLIAIAYLIQATVLDVELAHYLCHRIMGVVGNTFRGFVAGWCHAALGFLVHVARLWLGGDIWLFLFPFVIIKRRERRSRSNKCSFSQSLKFFKRDTCRPW